MSSHRSGGFPGFDPTVPNEARILDYLMGGKDNFAVDRQAAEVALKLLPDLPMICQEARGFLGRAVRFLAGEGVRQFIDVGCGLPAQGHVHEVLRPVAPDSKVVYVDIDPVVVAHGRALVDTGDTVRVVQADARDPDGLLDHPEVAQLIDLRRPVAIVLHSLLAVIPEDDVATMIVDRFVDRLPSGGYLLLSHAVPCPEAEATEQLARFYQENKVVDVRDRPRQDLRDPDEVARFLAGLPLVPPGLVPLPAWRPDPGGPAVDPAAVWVLGAVARKP